MINLDLEIAKQELKEKNLSLAIVKSKKSIFATNEHSVIGFLKAIDNLGEELYGASVADTVIGKAAAMLCCYAKITAAYACVISEKGVDTLNAAGIKFEYENLVPNILNRKRNDICPLEKLISAYVDEKECYEKIKNFFL